ncbi:MAG: hypothetical protein ACKPEY_21170, partial [Planctomycetota bacterium]
MHQGVVVDRRIEQAELRWRWRRWLRMTLAVLILMLVAVLAIHLLVAFEWLTSRSLYAVLLVACSMAAALRWLIGTLVIVLRPVPPEWMAAALERAQPQLADRIHTSVYLDEMLRSPLNRGATRPSGQLREQADIIQSFAAKIRDQAGTILRSPAKSPLFPEAPILWRVLLFLALLLAVDLLLWKSEPWNKLRSEKVALTPVSQPTSTLTIPPPTADVWEEPAPWGE